MAKDERSALNYVLHAITNVSSYKQAKVSSSTISCYIYTLSALNFHLPSSLLSSAWEKHHPQPHNHCLLGPTMHRGGTHRNEHTYRVGYCVKPTSFITCYQTYKVSVAGWFTIMHIHSLTHTHAHTHTHTQHTHTTHTHTHTTHTHTHGKCTKHIL